MIERSIELGYRSVFQDGKISPALLWEELEETADQHCRIIGKDVFHLLNLGEAWVLKGGASRMFRYPGYGESVRITSWLSSLDRYRGVREFRIQDGKDRVLGLVSTLWIYMDLNAHHLIPIPDSFHEHWGVSSSALNLSDFRKRPALPPGPCRENTISLRRRDIDTSDHVHNTRYLEWISEAVPEDVYNHCQISDFNILYRKEIKAGDVVQIRTLEQSSGCFHHDFIEKKSRTLLSTAYSCWNGKETLYPENPEYSDAAVQGLS